MIRFMYISKIKILLSILIEGLLVFFAVPFLLTFFSTDSAEVNY